MAGLFDKPEVLQMLKHLANEYQGNKITRRDRMVEETLKETIALLTNYIGDPEIRLVVKPIIIP